MVILLTKIANCTRIIERWKESRSIWEKFWNINMAMEFKMFFKNEVFIHNMLNNHHPKTLPVINIKIWYFSVSISNSSYQYYLAHLLLNKFLLGFTTQLKISLNLWLTFLCMEPLEKSDKSPPHPAPQKKM